MAGRGRAPPAHHHHHQPHHHLPSIGQTSSTSTPAPPRPCDGEFLLQLLHKNTSTSSSSSSTTTATAATTATISMDHQLIDPAIAALGPSHPFTHFPNNTLSAPVTVRSDIHQHVPPFSEIRFSSPPWPSSHNHYPSPGFSHAPPWNPPFPSMRIFDGFDPRSSHYQGPSPCDFGRKQQDVNVMVTKLEESTPQGWPLTFGSIPFEVRNQDEFSNGNCSSNSVKLVDAKSTVDSALRGSQQIRDNRRNHFHHQGRGDSRDKVKKVGSNVKQEGQFRRASMKDSVLDSQKEWGRAPGVGTLEKVGQGKGIEQWSERNKDREEDGPIKWDMDSFSLQGDIVGEEEMLPKKLLDIDFSPSPRSYRVDNVTPTFPLSDQIDHPGPPRGSNLRSAAASDIEQSLASLHGKATGEKSRHDARRPEREDGSRGVREQVMAARDLIDSLNLQDEFVSKNAGSHYYGSRGKELNKGLHLPGKRLRNHRREIECRSDLERHTPYFLSIYESLIPAEEEKVKQKQLLESLEKLISKEWPGAQLYLYGSCANSFGVSNSDIDVCMEINDADLSKSEILLRLADILLSGKLENVQALTRARVPIVKLMDPLTGISCDICINNTLAVVNTKLLRDYAEIDVRLRQLAFIVKHWAKSRRVNETYRGTLSSYAYVLMCIHFLQQRKPAILPCLQEMQATYVVTVDEIECAYFDQVEKLHDFGAQNKETVGQLLWSFFDYWAHRHDYANSVISVRTGSFISKRAKDWTRRIGNDRHLICIEDPFETSHDLGRVVDKYSIKTLREEFERAADILTYDSNPSVTLFEPYVPS